MSSFDKSNNETAETLSFERELHSDLKLLRDRVDQLQLDAYEKNRPWYRHVSTVISVLALLVSLITFVLGQHFEKQRAEQDQLTGVITKLIDERKEDADILKNQEADERHDELIRLENKRRIYIEQGELLISNLGKSNVVAAELTNLGYEEKMVGKLGKSASYFSNAIEVSHDDYEAWTTRVELADLYFYQPLVDFQKGRSLFLQASKSPGLTPGDLAFIYERWGFAELAPGHINEGATALECALACYEKAPTEEWIKKKRDDLHRKLDDLHKLAPISAGRCSEGC
jgi:hypothetical protein